jgi:hypothetical protein
VLSPGTYHLSVPKDRTANLKFRRNISRLARRGPREQGALRRACARDILFYINVFVWQHNPRKKGNEVGPFITWDFQDDAVRVILEQVGKDEDLFIEKSREMGASWLCLIIMDWLCRFHHWKKFLCISHSEMAVDRAEDPDSLFWKVDFMHRHLPDWLRGDVGRRKLGFAYPTRSALNGAASTGRSGVGGRATAIFLDEFSKQQDDFEILGQTADTTGCRVFNGTHYGVGGAFFELSERAKRGEIRRLVMHWTQHPEKRKGVYRWNPDLGRVEVLDRQYEFPADYKFVTDGTPKGGPFPGLRSPWYDKECRRRANSREVAMHLDIDPQGSMSQFFEPLIIAALIEEYCVPPRWQGDVRVDRDTGKPLGLASSPGGSLKLWLCPRSEDEVPAAPYVIGCDIAAGTGATPSCLSILNARTGEKVGEYTNRHIDPKDFGLVAVALCWLFQDEEGNPARLIWEMQGPGLSFASKVLEVGFRNIYYRTAEMPHSMEQKVSERPGWVPTPETKRILLEDYRSALALREFVNRSEEALKETLAFKFTPRGDVEHGKIEGGNDPTAARANHGDHVIADALAWKEARGKQVQQKEEELERPPVGSLRWRRGLARELQAAGSAW